MSERQPSLSGVLGEIQDIAGTAAALQIAAAKGGTTAYFPAVERLADDHWLVRAVGWDKAVALCRYFGAVSGIQIKIPLGPAGSRGRTWSVIDQGLRAGQSAADVARAAGVDERTVRRHRTGESGVKPGGDPRQGKLL